MTTSRQEAEACALVLEAAGIPHRLDEVPEGWALRVAWHDRTRASRELDAFSRENPPAAPPLLVEARARSYAGVTLALLLGGFHLITGPRDPDVSWFEAGSASANAIGRGEMWRAVTALTLHADPAHLLGNAVSSAVFVTALCRVIGVGMAAWLVLLAGGLGNAVTALLHGGGHDSVGASTAIFGAIGALAGLQVVAWRRRTTTRRRPWVPLAAGLALLAMLGTGPNADLAAHFFGFAVGAALGMAAALGLRQPPGRPAQLALALAAGAVIVACWDLALAGP